MEKAYICSPLAGNEKQNINNAIAYAKGVLCSFGGRWLLSSG